MRRFPLVFGAMRGKRVPDMLRALAPLEPTAGLHGGRRSGRAIATRAARRLAAQPAGVPVATAADAGQALELAAGLRRSADQPVVVAGSLYLVGAVRGMLAGEEAAA